MPRTLLKMNYFWEFYRRLAQVLTYLPQYFSALEAVIIRLEFCYILNLLLYSIPLDLTIFTGGLGYISAQDVFALWFYEGNMTY